jgi:coiled-coil domain-containing protein 55
MKVNFWGSLSIRIQPWHRRHTSNLITTPHERFPKQNNANMSFTGNKGLSYGLNIVKKSGGARPQPAKRKTIFDDEDDSDGENPSKDVEVEEVGEIGGLPSKKVPVKPSRNSTTSALNSGPPKLSASSKKAPISMYGDLSTSHTSKKHTETAEELDPSIYDYDTFHDISKNQKKAKVVDVERKPKYMNDLLAAASVRNRDRNIAEEKKLAREREAEGEEFADKEKFVTSAYKKQQEENRRVEAEEK